MGSGGSKARGGNGAPSSPSSSSSGVRRTRSMGNRVFHSSCLRPPPGSHDSDNDDQVSNHHNKETACNGPCTNQTETESNQVKIDYYNKVKADQPDGMPCISSNVGLDEWGQAMVTNTASGVGSSSARDSSTQSLNPSSRFLSRFSFIPGNISFRLSRATSLGSSRAYPASTSFTISDNAEELHLHTGPASALVNRNETPQDSDLLPGCLINRSPTRCYEDTSSNLRLDLPASGFSDNLRAERMISSHHGVRDGFNTRMGVDVNLHSPRTHAEIETNDIRLADRRIGAREPVERNVRFSRTLSVGRLRDRVLRRSSFSDLTFCPLQQEREMRDASQGGERQAWDGEMRALPSDSDVVSLPTSSGHPVSSLSGSLFSSEDYEVETSRPREARYHDLLEHRSNFLERRRRIRSQVRALQRLGNRFENLSGHERSCILSGQHRTGRCTCRINTRDANSNDDTGARASISRIVMLAEALFEVLDEIHQQSVVLSSRPSVSSIGSVPAPNEVVESLPVKLYTKVQKHQNEDAAQCYICLVEYEEGDTMRILPCHHEFHKTCIDKWLKEIHRVCPLCRGDICRSDSFPAEN